MISQYAVSNFKAIGKCVKFGLRPITLIFGPNSAGKSSLLHSFLLLKHIVEGGNPDVHRTSTGGEILDLGGRHQYAHLGQVDEETFWRFSENSLWMSGNRFAPFLSEGFGAKVYVTGSSARYSTPAPPIRTHFTAAPLTLGLVLSDADGEIMKYEGGAVTLFQHPVTEAMVSELLDAMTDGTDLEPVLTATGDLLALLGYFLSQRLPNPFDESELEGLNETYSPVEALLTANRISVDARDVLRAAYEFQIVTLGQPIHMLSSVIENLLTLEDYLDDSDLSTEEEETFDDYWQSEGLENPIVAAAGEVNDLYAAIQDRTLEPVLARITREAQGLMLQALHPARQIAYLGPLRNLPGTGGIRDTGETTLDSLGAEDWRAIVRDPKLRDRINEWLGPKRLGSNLQVSVKRLFREDTLLNALDHVSRGASIDPHNFFESLPAESATLVLHDRVRDREVNIRNVGVGISQVLPVLVRALSPGPNALHMIEQPELHLHPALQAELADVFIEGGRGANQLAFDEWSRWRKSFLIETHSEHLILRLLRRIRETTENRAPAGLDLTPDEIAVYYADPTGAGTRFLQMEISERGDFLTPWPDGFFPERLNELL